MDEIRYENNRLFLFLQPVEGFKIHFIISYNNFPERKNCQMTNKLMLFRKLANIYWEIVNMWQNIWVLFSVHNLNESEANDAGMIKTGCRLLFCRYAHACIY